MNDFHGPPPARLGRTERAVTRAYPVLGGRGGPQHRVLLTNPRQPPPYLTDNMQRWETRNDTVLGAITELQNEPQQMYLGTPLAAPYQGIRLPCISSQLVQSSPGYNEEGEYLGCSLQLPALLVTANQMALYQERGWDYDWKQAIGKMAIDAAGMIGRALSRRVLKWKMKPGFHGHALPRVGFPAVAPDRLIISQDFARKLYQKHELALRGAIGGWKGLNGFPLWVARFPVFEWGCLPMRLQLEEGGGCFLGINPWVMDKLLLGDFDGDQLYAAFRSDEVKDGTLSLTPFETRPWQNEFGAARAHTRLRDLRVPAGATGPPLPWYTQADGTNKIAEKAAFPLLSTPENRRAAVERADERRYVATFTMVFCWWIPRVLMQTRKYPAQEAYRLGHRAGQYWAEASFDARKGKSVFAQFDIHHFIELLNRGGEPLPIASLKAQRVPPEHLTVLEEAWRISGWDLKRECAVSPVYDDLVLKRNRLTGESFEELEHPVTEMLRVFQRFDPPIPPEEVYQAILDDFDGVELLGRPTLPTL